MKTRMYWVGAVALLALAGTAGAQEGTPAEEGFEPRAVEEVEPTVVAYREYPDPLEGWNRAVFSFNDGLYRVALIPLGNSYVRAVPPPVRGGIAGIFRNLREPLNALGHLLQGELRPAASNLARFGVNSTAGILGIFDPADAWLGLEEDPATLDEALRRHGVGAGAFLVIPVLGPSDLRGGASRFAEAWAHPVRHLVETPESTYILGFGNFQEFAPSGESYLRLRDEAEDPYLYFRNQHLQARQRDQDYPDE